MILQLHRALPRGRRSLSRAESRLVRRRAHALSIVAYQRFCQAMMDEMLSGALTPEQVAAWRPNNNAETELACQAQ